MESMEPTPNLSRDQALHDIQAIWSMNQQTGRMDSEAGDFATILRQVREGTLTPEEGVAQARGLADGRQDGFSG
jgi:hypothetical protein